MQPGDLSIILPEIILSIFAMGGLLIGAYGGKDQTAPAMLWGTAVLFLALAAWIGMRGVGASTAFSHTYVDDPFARFAKITVLLSAAAVLLMSEGYMARRGLLKFEYPLLIALAVVGMMVMVSAGDLIVLYMGLELQSLALYVVAALRRDSVKSTEAGLKYFVLGALSSGLLLYGASLVYGYSGSTQFSVILERATGQVPLGMLFGLSFVAAGLAFKVSAAPFHMWTPDVYEGSPTPVTAFFATAPKVAAMSLFARIAFDAFGGIVGDWQQILAFLSVISMFLGAVAAIGQRNIKRLMAYSSIGHMGYALVGLAAGTTEGVQGVLVYMSIYVAMTLGAFAVILSMRRDGELVENIGDLAGLSRTHPTMAFVLAMLLFSLAGIPPLAGFFAKFYVFLAAIQAGLYPLAVIGVLASVVGAYYYLAIVKIMYFDEPVRGFDAQPPLLRLVLGVAGVINILFFAYPAPLVGAATAAAKSLF